MDEVLFFPFKVRKKKIGRIRGCEVSRVGTLKWESGVCVTQQMKADPPQLRVELESPIVAAVISIHPQEVHVNTNPNQLCYSPTQRHIQAS